MSSAAKDGYVRATSDNIPKVDSLMLLDFASQAEQFISAEVRNIKSDRSMRDSYTAAAVGRVSLKRESVKCTLMAEVCPEHKNKEKNYSVTIVIDEQRESIEDLKCLSCAASKGGCKHALAFLMWLSTESSKPSPTTVKSYWNKPKLSNISASAVLKTTDFGEVPSPDNVDVAGFFAVVSSPSAPISSFQRYNSEVDEISKLDMHYLCIKFVESLQPDQGASASPESFREFCKSSMTEEACAAAFKETAGQTNSRHWPLLRYARTSASNVYEASRSKKSTGGVLKELILGGTKLKLTKSMKRGQDLEKVVLAAVTSKKNLQVQELGIQLSKEHPEFGASPDGLTDDYVIEIKCPETEKAVKRYIKDGRVASKYLAQIQLQMKLCKRSKGLFCVASPDFESTRKVTILTVQYDPQFIDLVMKKASLYWDKHIFPVLMSSALA